MTELIEEIIDFGNKIGKIKVIQFSYYSFHNKCLKINSQNQDNTGLRLQGATNVAVQLLNSDFMHNLLFNSINGIRLCELGCGTGVFGLLGTNLGRKCVNLTITDGNAEAVNLAKLNYDNWILLNKQDLNSSLNNVRFAALPWGLPDKVNELIINHNDNSKYDVVIGCELIYYNTDFNELFSTVKSLILEDGLFVHVHFIRLSNQADKINEILYTYDWITIEIPVEDFVSQEDLLIHQEWYRARCLLSGNKIKISQYLKDFPTWKLFTEDII